jgi:hypothetical protein
MPWQRNPVVPFYGEYAWTLDAQVAQMAIEWPWQFELFLEPRDELAGL